MLTQSVALQFLNEMNDKSISGKVLPYIVKTCQFMHSSVIQASDEFLQVRIPVFFFPFIAQSRSLERLSI